MGLDFGPSLDVGVYGSVAFSNSVSYSGAWAPRPGCRGPSQPMLRYRRRLEEGLALSVLGGFLES